MARLIDELVTQGFVSRSDIEQARIKQIGAKKPLHELLVEMGFMKETDLIQVASEVFDMPVSCLNEEAIDPAVVKLIPYEMAKRYGVFPVRKEGNVLVLAMSDPVDIVAEDTVHNQTKMEIKPILSTRTEIALAIEEYYHADESIYDLLKNIESDATVKIDLNPEAKGVVDTNQELVRNAASPIARVVDLILADAVKMRASDIHMEPYEKNLKIRYRIDGDLRDILEVPHKIRHAVINRVKILTDLDLAETRKPQDGRTRIKIYNRNISLRVSTVPTYYGEKAVLRMLDPQGATIQIDKIGLMDKEMELLKTASLKPQGMVLVTGPTGSGKTSTLYAALNFIKSETKNIITIEDPVEYVIEGVSQIQVNPIKDVTFANGLRSILRQDPNVILVGEIRDRETANIAFRASLTGHLVLSTLHTNSVVATVVRLFDLGLEPYLIASALNLIVAQRLVRLICPDCKEVYTPEQNILDAFKTYINEFKITTFYRGQGCKKCGFSGFIGRTAIFEILPVSDNIKTMITNKAAEEDILKEAQKEGFTTLTESGVHKVSEGLTTFEELAKVVNIVCEKSIMQTAPGTVRKRPKILITEDEDDIAMILRVRLKAAGYDTVRARDGEEAVKLAVIEKPDLILMDIMMPKIDGFQATKELRAGLQTAVIPIIMLTAKSDIESELKGLDAGADDYIAKPFDVPRLLARIRLLLKRKNSDR